MNVYNGVQFLPSTLSCVFSQTFQDWELIFWDDCSTDNSADCLEKFDDPRIRYFRSETLVNLSQAREYAVLEARGQWVAFLDQDDLWSNDKLELQHALATKSNSSDLGIIYTNSIVFSEKGDRRLHDYWHCPDNLPDGNIFEELFRYGNYIAMSSVALRRDLVLAAMPFPHRFGYLPDYHMHATIAQNHKTAVINKICCWYRNHWESTTNQNMVEMFQQTLAFVEEWESRVPTKVYRRRFQIQQTLLGFELLRHGTSLREAFWRLLIKGNLLYFLTRPIARALRTKNNPNLPAPPC